MKNEDVIFDPRLAGQVSRYHTWPRNRDQSVGEHSWQVMRIYCELYDREPPSVVWRYVHQHDMPEIRTGDLPFSRSEPLTEQLHLKASMSELEGKVRTRMGLLSPAALTDVEKGRVKVCDLLDCWEWGLHEYRTGNRFGIPVMQNVLPVAREIHARNHPPQSLESWLVSRMKGEHVYGE